MLVKDNPYSFLTGVNPFMPMELQTKSEQQYVAKIYFDFKHEGFVGIPHGGIGMGLCLDTWRNIGVSNYPVTVNFKFGGSGISIGDQAYFEIDKPKSVDQGLHIKITKEGDKKPYLRAEIAQTKETKNFLPTWLGNYEKFRALPYYKNCFVCGHSRKEPGLERRFRVHEDDHIV
ncbi:MAG: hypothetical protein ACP5VS_06915, partial [Desulfomonilaceae bacterium]